VEEEPSSDRQAVSAWATVGSLRSSPLNMPPRGAPVAAVPPGAGPVALGLGTVTPWSVMHRRKAALEPALMPPLRRPPAGRRFRHARRAAANAAGSGLVVAPVVAAVVAVVVAARRRGVTPCCSRHCR
jgi:hypothetical protein